MNAPPTCTRAPSSSSSSKHKEKIIINAPFTHTYAHQVEWRIFQPFFYLNNNNKKTIITAIQFNVVERDAAEMTTIKKQRVSTCVFLEFEKRCCCCCCCTLSMLTLRPTKCTHYFFLLLSVWQRESCIHPPLRGLLIKQTRHIEWSTSNVVIFFYSVSIGRHKYKSQQTESFRFLLH